VQKIGSRPEKSHCRACKTFSWGPGVSGKRARINLLNAFVQPKKSDLLKNRHKITDDWRKLNSDDITFSNDSGGPRTSRRLGKLPHPTLDGPDWEALLVRYTPKQQLRKYSHHQVRTELTGTK